jgi:hypothetical protein
MPEIQPVLLKRGQTLLEGTLSHYESENAESPCVIELRLNERTIIGKSEDYFDALIQVRKTLEKDSVFLLIYGVSKNVWPSAMARSMGAGLRAYKMTMGKQAVTADLVEIFASGPDVQPCTVVEQEKYKDEWFVSLGAA